MDVDSKTIERIVRQVIAETIKTEENTNINFNTVGEKSEFIEIGKAKPSHNVKEVGIAIGPAFGISIHNTINGIPHKEVLKEVMAGIEEEGMIPRVIRVTRTSDVGFMANDVAKLTGSGVAVGIQSKGTAVIHQKDLNPLTNLELFPQAPLLTLRTYRKIGQNTAKYAKGELVKPISIENDPMSRPKYQVVAALMHTKETELVVNRGPYIEIDTSL